MTSRFDWNEAARLTNLTKDWQGVEAFVVVQAYKIQPLPDPLFHTRSSPLCCNYHFVADWAVFNCKKWAKKDTY